MGRKKMYTPKEFSTAIDEYFDEISMLTPVVELYDTGKVTAKGYPIMASRGVKRANGEPYMIRKWLEPPGIAQLCVRLGISKQTFENYAKDERYIDSITRARMRVEAYLTTQLESAKNPSGIIFNLMNNFKWKNQNNETVDANVEFKIGEDVSDLAD